MSFVAPTKKNRSYAATLLQPLALLISSGTPLQVAHYRIEEARALAALGQTEGAAAVAMRVVAQLDGTHPGDAGRAYILLGEIFDRLGAKPWLDRVAAASPPAVREEPAEAAHA